MFKVKIAFGSKFLVEFNDTKNLCQVLVVFEM